VFEDGFYHPEMGLDLLPLMKAAQIRIVDLQSASTARDFTVDAITTLTPGSSMIWSYANDGRRNPDGLCFGAGSDNFIAAWELADWKQLAVGRGSTVLVKLGCCHGTHIAAEAMSDRRWADPTNMTIMHWNKADTGFAHLTRLYVARDGESKQLRAGHMGLLAARTDAAVLVTLGPPGTVEENVAAQTRATLAKNEGIAVEPGFSGYGGAPLDGFYPGREAALRDPDTLAFLRRLVVQAPPGVPSNDTRTTRDELVDGLVVRNQVEAVAKMGYIGGVLRIVGAQVVTEQIVTALTGVAAGAEITRQTKMRPAIHAVALELSVRLKSLPPLTEDSAAEFAERWKEFIDWAYGGLGILPSQVRELIDFAVEGDDAFFSDVKKRLEEGVKS
jgi:hypothetical protein